MKIDQQQLGGLYTIFETLPSGLLIYDHDENVIQMNSRAKELLKIPLQKSIQTLRDLPDYLVELRILLQNAEEDIPRSEINLLFPEAAETSTIGFSMKHIRLEDTVAQARIFVFNDITHIVRDRRAMDKIKEELYQSKKLASIGTMISGVAHELNNPLTGISMSTQLTRMTLKAALKKLDENGNGDPRVRGALEKALQELDKTDREAKKASALVSELLNYSRPSKMTLTLENLSRVIEEMVQALKSHPDFSPIRFEIQPGPAELEVLCDRLKIEQVFYNLFKNAVDATGGKGTIRISFHETTEPRENRHMLVVNVADEGPGMDKTILARIFDPFFTTKGAEGIGLGLSISYRTIEQHGGQITVDSEKGKGTVFHVALPVFEEDEILI